MEQFKPETGPVKNSTNKEDLIEEKEKRYRTLKIHISSLCKCCKTNTEALECIKEAIRNDVPTKEVTESAISELEKCDCAAGQKEFREAIFQALKPIADLRVEKPELFEQKEKEDVQNKETFVQVNELFSYEIDKDHIHIHVVPEDRVENVLSKFNEGLQKLTKVVEEHPEIKSVTATSWIVGEYPKIIERFGFTLDGEIDKELREKHFKNEKRKVWMAHMNRDEFIKRYLK
jgi:hypothetical protein